jgi:hypothetical protein
VNNVTFLFRALEHLCFYQSVATSNLETYVKLPPPPKRAKKGRMPTPSSVFRAHADVIGETRSMGAHALPRSFLSKDLEYPLEVTLEGQATYPYQVWPIRKFPKPDKSAPKFSQETLAVIFAFPITRIYHHWGEASPKPASPLSPIYSPPPPPQLASSTEPPPPPPSPLVPLPLANQNGGGGDDYIPLLGEEEDGDAALIFDLGLPTPPKAAEAEVAAMEQSPPPSRRRHRSPSPPPQPRKVEPLDARLSRFYTLYK